MFSAYTIFDNKNFLYRSPFPSISITEFKTRINKENTPEEGTIEIDGYTYTYIKKNNNSSSNSSNMKSTTYALITKDICINKVNELFLNLTNYLTTIDFSNFEDIIYAIDDCLNQHCYFVLSSINLQTNNQMESYDEKIYEIEMKNKELMAIKEMKIRSMRDEGYFIDNDYNQLINDNLINDNLINDNLINDNLNNYNIDNNNNNNDINNNKLPKRINKEIYKELNNNEFPKKNDKEIQIFIFEKIKVSLIDNKVDDYSLTGEMSMFLRNKIEKLKYSHKGIIKFSPNLSKEHLRNGFLKPNREFPLNKIIKLAKWSSQKAVKYKPKFNSKDKKLNSKDKNPNSKDSKLNSTKIDYYECPLSFTIWDDENIIEIEFYEDVYELKIENDNGFLNVGDVKKGVLTKEINSSYPIILRFKVEPVINIEIEGDVERKCEYEIFVNDG
ncbi:hypothetical protein DMUE_0880 [Dictyocoela muelleri]|nr:hypothetical protein DMUE_0880 [Dictyocoela muelleri]